MCPSSLELDIPAVEFTRFAAPSPSMAAGISVACLSTFGFVRFHYIDYRVPFYISLPVYCLRPVAGVELGQRKLHLISY